MATIHVPVVDGTSWNLRILLDRPPAPQAWTLKARRIDYRLGGAGAAKAILPNHDKGLVIS